MYHRGAKRTSSHRPCEAVEHKGNAIVARWCAAAPGARCLARGRSHTPKSCTPLFGTVHK